MTPDALLHGLFQTLHQRGWAHFTLAEFCESHSIGLSDLPSSLSSKEDLGDLFLDYLDETLDQFTLHENAPWKDQVFDLFMTRFDLLTPLKPGVLELSKAILLSPILLTRYSCRLNTSIMKMISKATPKEGGAFRREGLIPVYGWVFWTWLQDTTPDLSKTMAALDQALDKYLEFYKSAQA